MTGRGQCVAIREDFYVNYTIVFKTPKCFTCVKFLVRTVNVLEKIESN